MFVKRVLPVLAAAAYATAQSDTCTQDTFTIAAQADIDTLSNCTTLTGDVVLSSSTSSSLDLSGIETIDGDLTLESNSVVMTLKSSSITSITGAFHLQNLTTLSTLAFTSLTSVGSINWVSLTAIDVLTFTAGIQTADSIVISDTFLSDLDGIDVTTADTVNINNNRRLVSFSSSLTNVTELLNINANGQDLDVSFPDLTWIANMTISNVSSLSLPLLEVVNGSMRFDSNFFTNFSAPNMTSTTSGDLSFVSNGDLSTISMPKLVTIGGGFLIANNTELHNVTGFPELKTVLGAVNMRGNFTHIELPSLSDVRGAFDIVSTGDISSDCTTFEALSSTKNGGNGDIQGTFTCESNNANANSDTSSTGSSSSSSSSSSDSAAAGINVNFLAVLGLAGVAGIAQML